MSSNQGKLPKPDEGGWRRRRSSTERPTARDPETPVPGIEEALVDRDRVWHLLTVLPVRQRAVLVLRYYESLPDAEIAELIGRAEGTVRQPPGAGVLYPTNLLRRECRMQRRRHLAALVLRGGAQHVSAEVPVGQWVANGADGGGVPAGAAVGGGDRVGGEPLGDGADRALILREAVLHISYPEGPILNLTDRNCANLLVAPEY